MDGMHLSSMAISKEIEGKQASSTPASVQDGVTFEQLVNAQQGCSKKPLCSSQVNEFLNQKPEALSGDARRTARSNGTSAAEMAGAERRANRGGNSQPSAEMTSQNTTQNTNQTSQPLIEAKKRAQPLDVANVSIALAARQEQAASKKNQPAHSESTPTQTNSGRGPGWDALPGHKKALGYTAVGEGTQTVNKAARGDYAGAIDGISSRAYNFSLGFGGADGFGGDSHDRDYAKALGFTYDSQGSRSIQDVFRANGNDGSAHISQNGQIISQRIFKKADDLGFLNDNHLSANEIARL